MSILDDVDPFDCAPAFAKPTARQAGQALREKEWLSGKPA